MDKRRVIAYNMGLTASKACRILRHYNLGGAEQNWKRNFQFVQFIPLRNIRR
jgi:hypothetical protein